MKKNLPRSSINFVKNVPDGNTSEDDSKTEIALD